MRKCDFCENEMVLRHETKNGWIDVCDDCDDMFSYCRDCDLVISLNECEFVNGDDEYTYYVICHECMKGAQRDGVS